MTQAAVISLVRKSTVDDANEHDYATTTAELGIRHDEIRLVDPDGEPCAVPMTPGEDDIDYTYDYVTGAEGHSLRGTKVSQEFSIDYVEHVVWTWMKRWQRERARVWVGQNIGRNTLFSWQPRDLKAGYHNGGPAAYDLTGNHALTATFGAYLRYWDPARRLFLPKTSSNRTQLILTPAGAGLTTFQNVRNRMRPTYPESATMGGSAGDSGWLAAGADSAGLTPALVTNGFGQTDCPHSLRIVVTGAVTADRYLYASEIWDSGHADYAGYTFANSLTAVATVWLRGQLPDGATLNLGVVGGTVTSRSLAGLRLDGWTPVSVSHYTVAWDAGLPYLSIGCNSTTGAACEFEIGPTFVGQMSGYSNMAVAPVWSDENGTDSGAAKVATTAAIRLPGQGTIICSFWAPSDVADAWRGGESRMVLCGNSDLTLHYSVSSAGTDTITLAGASPAATVSYTSATRGGLGFAGKVNTVAVTWDNNGIKLYANGVLMVTDTSALPTVAGSSSALQIGNSVSGYGCAPLAICSLRVDEGAMTATEIAQVHTALTDPVALALTHTCAGRTFRIDRVPQTLRSAVGGSQVLGVLGLRQVDYDPFGVDPFLKEASVV